MSLTPIQPPKEEIIQFVGLKELTPEEQEVVKKISEHHYNKIKRAIKNRASLVLHIKCYSEKGKRKKFSLHIKVLSPTKTFTSDKVHDWELEKALHKAFNDLPEQIHHEFHGERGYKKSYE